MTQMIFIYNYIQHNMIENIDSDYKYAQEREFSELGPFFRGIFLYK